MPPCLGGRPRPSRCVENSTYGRSLESSSMSTIHATASGVPWKTFVKSHVANAVSVEVLSAPTRVPSVLNIAPSRT